MVGLIIATSILGGIVIADTVLGIIFAYKSNKNLSTVAQCLATHLIDANNDEVEEYADIVHSDFNFPNSEGGF